MLTSKGPFLHSSVCLLGWCRNGNMCLHFLTADIPPRLLFFLFILQMPFGCASNNDVCNST